MGCCLIELFIFLQLQFDEPKPFYIFVVAETRCPYLFVKIMMADFRFLTNEIIDTIPRTMMADFGDLTNE